MSLPKPYYEDDHVQIFHGDCREILPSIEADVLVTDPPYGLNAPLNSGGKRGKPTPASRRAVPAWDRDLRVRDELLAVFTGPALMFASVTAPRPDGFRDRPLVWDKGEAVGMGDVSLPWKPNTEFIWIRGGGFTGHRGSSVLRSVVSPGDGRQHPTQKPVGLMADLIAKCPPDWTVLDPFMGSGSTLRAAKDLGRKAIGIELEEKYCQIAAERCAQDVLDLGSAA